MSEQVPNWPLFENNPGADAACMCAILIGSMIAAGGGLGGGGVFVPIYILILSYETKYAAALSQATIFGGSIVNLAMNLRKFHPKRSHRPLTDFSTLLIFEPMLLVGTVIGVLLNVLFPDILILICLIVVLLYATVRTTRKGIRLWKKESAELNSSTSDSIENARKIKTDLAEIDIEMETVASNSPTALSDDVSEIPNTENQNETTDGLKSDMDEDRGVDTKKDVDNELIEQYAEGCGVDAKQINTDNKRKLSMEFIEKEAQITRPLVIIFIVWIAVSLTSIVKAEGITGIAKCSASYWVLTFLPFPVMSAVSLFMTKREYNHYQRKINSDIWIPAPGDIELKGKFIRILKYPLIATIAGILGGLLGIGGGMIVSPLLIELGVIPTVAAATSAMAVMITSSSAMLQFLLLGFLDPDYMFFFMAVGIIGTFIGQTAVNYAVKEYGRVSVVIFAVATIMGLAIILMAVNGVTELTEGISWAFQDACAGSSESSKSI